MRNVFFIFFRYCNNSRKKNIKYYRIKVDGEREEKKFYINKLRLLLVRSPKIIFFIFFFRTKIDQLEAATKIAAIADVSAPAMLQLQPQDQQNFVTDVQPLLPPPQNQSIVVNVETEPPKKNIVKRKIAPLPPSTPPPPPPPSSKTLRKPVRPAPALPNVVHKSMPCALNFERNTRTTQSCRPKTKKDNFASLTYIAQVRTLLDDFSSPDEETSFMGSFTQQTRRPSEAFSSTISQSYLACRSLPPNRRSTLLYESPRSRYKLDFTESPHNSYEMLSLANPFYASDSRMAELEEREQNTTTPILSEFENV